MITDIHTDRVRDARQAHDWLLHARLGAAPNWVERGSVRDLDGVDCTVQLADGCDPLPIDVKTTSKWRFDNSRGLSDPDVPIELVSVFPLERLYPDRRVFRPELIDELRETYGGGVVGGEPGWTWADTPTRYIHWLIAERRTLRAVSFVVDAALLRLAVRVYGNTWARTYGSKLQETVNAKGSFHSQFVYVPLSQLRIALEKVAQAALAENSWEYSARRDRQNHFDTIHARTERSMRGHWQADAGDGWKRTTVALGTFGNFCRWGIIPGQGNEAWHDYWWDNTDCVVRHISTTIVPLPADVQATKRIKQEGVAVDRLSIPFNKDTDLDYGRELWTNTQLAHMTMRSRSQNSTHAKDDDLIAAK